MGLGTPIYTALLQRRQVTHHLHCGAAPDGRLASAVFELPADPRDHAGAWRRADKGEAPVLKGVTREELKLREGCTIYFSVREDGSPFEGSTVEDDCGSTLRGASYATSQVSNGEKVLESWDRGYDAEGEQVWGAMRGAYRFVKRPPDAVPKAKLPAPETPETGR